MKQQITKEQWNELSRDAKNTWYEFALKRGYVKHTISKWDGGINYETKSEMDTPNIGQMIEYLEDENRSLNKIENIFHRPVTYSNIENICDALWEAVKQVT